MLDPRDESQLVGGGDTLLHFHLSDRIPTHDTIEQLQSLDHVFNISGDTVLEGHEDLILVDTQAASVTITLATAFNGREVEVMKNAAANRLTIVPSGTDLILGATAVQVYNYGTALRFKAITGGWIII